MVCIIMTSEWNTYCQRLVERRDKPVYVNITHQVELSEEVKLSLKLQLLQ